MQQATSVSRRFQDGARPGADGHAPPRSLRGLPRWRASREWRVPVRNPFAARRFAVVLSGGATRGAFQVGVIDALVRHGIVPDLLVGTSVGAINAAYWAFHADEEVGPGLLEVWRDAERLRVLPDRPLRIVGNLIGSRLHERSSLARLLARELPTPTATIESARLPLHIVACSLLRGTPVDFDRGPALPALLASAAVPAVFPPVMVDGEPYADGGLVANCPIDVARSAGATDILAVDLVGESPWVPGGGLGALERAVNISLADQTRREVESFRGSVRIALLCPSYALSPGFGDFSQTLVLYRQGQLAGERFLTEHWLGAGRVRPGVMEFEAPGMAATVERDGQHPRRLRTVLETVHRPWGRARPAEPEVTPALEAPAQTQQGA